MSDLLRFLFYGEAPPVFKIRRTKVRYSEKENVPPEKPSDERQEKHKIIMIITWVLCLALIACLSAAFIQMYRDKPIPDFIILVIGGVIGYFGGAFSVYFGFQPTK